jgi:HAD superfamily hydrolase (TIGR01484 family)
MKQIKAIVADVDGVMVGKKEGVNFPLPPQEIIRSLKQISARGIPIILCTAKFGYAIKDIAIQAKLSNPHITDGGALIIDWLDDVVVSQSPLNKDTMLEYIHTCLEQDIYTELYTADCYYIQKSQISELTVKRSKLLQMEPQIAESIFDVARHTAVIKIINSSEGSADMPTLESNADKFGNKLNYIWTQHPYITPHKLLIVTAPGVSKQHAAREVMSYLNISFESVLGVGDSESDWNFMQLCNYVATIGSSGGKLQHLAQSKGEDHYFFASSVEDNGMLEALEHFKLLG